MENKIKLLLGAGVGITTLGVAVYLWRGGQESQVTLSYDSDLGSVSVNGQPTAPGTYTYRGTIKLTAAPKSGNYFLGWLVNETSKGTDLTLSLTLGTPYELVIALFSTTPTNGGTHIPSTIIALNSPVSMSQRVSCGIIQHFPVNFTHVIKYKLADWSTEGIEVAVAKLKIEDSAGNGIGGIPVQVWTNDMPDNNDNRAAGGGNLFLSDGIHESGNPLVIYSLGSGEVQVQLKYLPVDFGRFALQHNHVCAEALPFYRECKCYGRDGELTINYAGPRSIKFDCPANSADAPGNHWVGQSNNIVYAKVKDTVLSTQALVTCALEIMQV